MADREKIIEILEKAKTIIERWIPMFEQYNTPAGIDNAITLLKEQEPVVRCKYCTHAEHCEIYAGWDGQNPEWYCGDGERRNNDA